MKFFKIKNLIKTLVLAVVIYAALLFIGDYNSISNQLSHLNLLVIPTILSLVFIENLISFYQWNFLLKRLDIKVPLKSSFLIFFSGLSMVITPAKVGEVLKSYLLKKSDGIKIRKSIMVVVFERLVDLLSLAILALIGSFAFIRSLYFQIMILILISVLSFIFILLTNRRIFFKFSSILNRVPFIKNYVKYLDHIYQSSTKLISFKTLIVILPLSTFGWFLECSSFYLLLNALNASLQILPATFIFSFSSVFGSATLIPGGLIAAESSFVALLLLQGISLANATLATVLIRLLTLFWGFSMGVIALFFTNKLLKKKGKSI